MDADHADILEDTNSVLSNAVEGFWILLLSYFIEIMSCTHTDKRRKWGGFGNFTGQIRVWIKNRFRWYFGQSTVEVKSAVQLRLAQTPTLRL